MDTSRGLKLIQPGPLTNIRWPHPPAVFVGRVPHVPRGCVLLIMGWVLIASLTLLAQVAKPSEYDVKAAYLYNFGKFIEWPARPAPVEDGVFRICVLGQDPFGSALNAILAGETISGAKVVNNPVAKAEDAVNCRILFISSSESVQLKHILAALANTGVLTVSDMPEFSQRGGMIQFVWQGNRVRFQVNLESAKRAGLTISSELLKLALNASANARLKD